MNGFPKFDWSWLARRSAVSCCEGLFREISPWKSNLAHNAANRPIGQPASSNRFLMRKGAWRMCGTRAQPAAHALIDLIDVCNWELLD